MFIRIDKQKNNLLIKAYKDGDINKFRKLIDSGANVNCLCDDGYSLVFWVLKNINNLKNNVDFFDELIKNDVYFEKIGLERNLFRIAMDCDSDYYIDQLLKHNKNINQKYEYNIYGDDNGPLIFDTIKYNMNYIEKVLNYKPDLKIFNSMGYTVINYFFLHCHAYCLFNSSHDNFRKLLLAGADFNLENTSNGMGGIHSMACHCRDDSYFKILNELKIPFDINHSNNTVSSPIFWAVKWDNLFAVEILLEMGVDLKTFQEDGACALTMAAVCNHKKIFDLLLEREAELPIFNENKDNILHHLVRRYDCEPYYVETILNNRPELSVMENNDGMTPYDVFNNQESKNRHIAKILSNNKK